MGAWRATLKAIKALEKWAFILTFAGVGLRTRFSDMGRAGWKPFIVGISTEAAVAAFTLAMVLILGGCLTPANSVESPASFRAYLL